MVIPLTHYLGAFESGESASIDNRGRVLAKKGRDQVPRRYAEHLDERGECEIDDEENKNPNLRHEKETPDDPVQEVLSGPGDRARLE